MLHCTGINEWAVALDADKLSFPFEYKFAAYTDGAFGCWEEGFNHSIDEYAMFGTETRVVDGGEVNLQMSAWRGAGMVVPIFSIRTESSFGVGDFGDLKKLIDWVASLHQRVLQILPINDTTITNTWVDSYPYSSISIYAFHPMYANLVKVGVLDEHIFYGPEDADWCLRVKQAGWKIHCLYNYTIMHDYRRSTKTRPLSPLGRKHIKALLYFYWKTKRLF